MSEQTASEDREKDQYPPDSQFGRAAATDAELVDEIEKSGASADDDALVDEQSEESFPASDPPSNR